MSFPRYEKYKDSGINWLGEIPSHWQARRAKFLFDRKQRPVSDDDDIVTAFRDGQVTLRKNRREDGFTVALKEIGYQGVRQGDLVVHAMDAFAGAVGVSDSDGKCSPVYSCCEPKEKVIAPFYGYLVRTMALAGFIESLAKGVRERSTDFRWGDFSSLELPLPPVEEQKQAVSFIAKETGKIDALVAEQEKLIRLLKEKRQAVISHAVTKGLDPNAKMKDSGVEWLGEVPEGWEVKPIKAIASCNDDVLGESTAEDYEIEYVEISGVNSDRGITETITIPFGQAPSRARRIVKDGDVLISTVRTYLRAIAPVKEPPENLIVSTGFAVIRPRSGSPDFLGYLFHTEYLISEVIARSVGVSYPAINSSELMRLFVPIPPLPEQRSIAAFLDHETGKIDALIEEAKKAIELMKERRTALISAAVTGKIDVSKAQ